MIIKGNIIKPYEYIGLDSDKVISNSTILIGNNSFMHSNVEYASFGPHLTYIGIDAFYNCNKLKSIILPQKLMSIDDGAFNCCTNLNYELPKNIRDVGIRAFQGCACKKLIIPSTLEIISIGAFGYNNITDVTISNGVRVISNESFYGNPIKTLTLPDSVVSISQSAFSVVENVICSSGSYSCEYFKKYFKNTNIIIL